MPFVLNERIKKVKIIYIRYPWHQSSNIIAKLEKCLTLWNTMTNKHKSVDISLYSIRSIDTNLKSCTHASLVMCLNLVSMAT